MLKLLVQAGSAHNKRPDFHQLAACICVLSARIGQWLSAKLQRQAGPDRCFNPAILNMRLGTACEACLDKSFLMKCQTRATLSGCHLSDIGIRCCLA